MSNEPVQRELIERVRVRLDALAKANAAPRCGARSKPGPDYGVYRELPGQEMPSISPRPEAWDRWLADRPLSENIEDRRGDDQTDLDEIRWQKWYGPKKALKQFPPAETDTHAKSTTPDWLKDQESQWLKANKKHSPSAAKQ